ncbi:hypothetical protein LSUE1_G008973 [Lachnellula suecica]|uniref:AB hydrolase-1 domain-containing protein n=1 Tax=Lachnellula suecica TaxID=602035 RepID=A0A8T9BTC9_9HELO|nr:hypothetical protein LSUE1_G008973 [Lachnellula suecica]
MGKPTFVCVPGAWHTPTSYSALAQILETHGYECILLSLPSVGCNPVTHDFSEDVAVIWKTVTALAEAGQGCYPRHTFLRRHAGKPGVGAFGERGEGSEGVGGWGGAVRLRDGHDAHRGKSQPAARGTRRICRRSWRRDFMFVSHLLASRPAHLQTSNNSFALHRKESDAISVFYNDTSPSIAAQMAAELETQSLGVFWSTVTYAPWRKTPTTFVLLENDRSFTMGYAKYLLGAARATGDHMIDTLEKCDAGHFVMVSRPDWLAGVLRRAAGERV